jgi:hypothetical protein
VVATAHDHHIAAHGNPNHVEWLRRGPLYLYTVLIREIMNLDRLATSKTINVLTLAVLIAFLFFGTQWFLWLALLLSLGNTVESRVTSTLARYWMKFAAVLGAFNSKVILTLTFYLILTPIAFVYRIFNHHSVDHFRVNKRLSYFEERNKTYTQADFEKTW